MKKKILLLIINVLVLSTYNFAQLQMSSMMRDNLSLLNPAAVDLDILQYRVYGGVEAVFQNRWMGFDDNAAPDDFIAGVSFTTNALNEQFRWGGNFIYDKAGAYNNLNLNFTGALVMKLNFKGRNMANQYNTNFLSLGINIGMETVRFQYDKMYTEEEDPLIHTEQNMPILLLPRPGIGLYYFHFKSGKDAYFVGVSLPNLFPYSSSLYDFENASITTLPPLFSSFGQLSVQAGYRKVLAKDHYVDFSAWTRTPIIKNFEDFPTMINALVKYNIDTKVWVGLGAAMSFKQHDFSALSYDYRGNNHISLSTGFIWSNRKRNWLKSAKQRKRKGSLYQIGFGYQNPIGELALTNFGNVELFFRLGQL